MLSHLHKSRLLPVLFCFSFFVSGIVLNITQLLALITIGSINKGLYRKISYYLNYSLWSHIVAICEWWSGSSFVLYFADEDSLRTHAKNHTLFVMNHRYESEFFFGLMFCDKFDTIGVQLFSFIYNIIFFY